MVTDIKTIDDIRKLPIEWIGEFVGTPEQVLAELAKSYGGYTPPWMIVYGKRIFVPGSYKAVKE